MTTILSLFLRRGRILGKIVRDCEGAKLAVIALFVLLFVLVMVGEYLIFRQGLLEVLNIGPPSAALTLYMLEAFLILVLVLSVVSFVATGLWTFYRALDTAFLLSTPLPLTHLFWLRVSETLALTSWPFVILGIPALLALGAAYGMGAPFYLRSLLVLLLFTALAAGLGTFLATLAGAAFRRFGARTGILLATVILVGAFAFLVGRQVVPSLGDFYRIFEPGIPNGKPASIKFIEERFRLWPSHPLAVSLYAAVRATPAGSDALAVAAWGLPGLALAVAGVVGRRLFAATLPVVAEGSAGRRAGEGRRGRFPRLLPGPAGAVVERDLRALGRSPHELGRAAFILFLLVLSTGILFVAPLREVLERPAVAARLFALDLVAIGYFLTAFGIRFVFPSLSLEGQAAWVLFASPVPLGRLFLAKLLAYVALLLLAVGPIAVVGALRLVSPPALLASFGLLLALLIVTTTAVALAFGILWPNFKETNAESLATNAGGLATILVCLGYVAAVGWVGHQAVQAFFGGESVLPYLGGAVVLSAAVVAAAGAAARRRLAAFEIL